MRYKNLLAKPVPTWSLLISLAALAVSIIAYAHLESTVTEYPIVSGQVINVTEELKINSTQLTLAAKDAGPVGTDPSTAVTMGPVNPTTNTELKAGHWQYMVTFEAVNTTTPNFVYKVDLQLNGIYLPSLYIQTSPTVAPGVDLVTCVFDIGVDLHRTSAFLTLASKFGAPVVTLREYFLNAWRDAFNNTEPSGPNPNLTATVGETIRITILGKDSLHNIAIYTPGYPTGDVFPDNPDALVRSADVRPDQTASITWTPTATGTYIYICEYHPSMMVGNLVVT